MLWNAARVVVEVVLGSCLMAVEMANGRRRTNVIVAARFAILSGMVCKGGEDVSKPRARNGMEVLVPHLQSPVPSALANRAKPI